MKSFRVCQMRGCGIRFSTLVLLFFWLASVLTSIQMRFCVTFASQARQVTKSQGVVCSSTLVVPISARKSLNGLVLLLLQALPRRCASQSLLSPTLHHVLIHTTNGI